LYTSAESRSEPAIQAGGDRLIAPDGRPFQRLRSAVAAGRFTRSALRRELNRYTAYRPGKPDRTHVGFDDLDSVVDAILGIASHADLGELLDPEMVHYEPTPARIVLDFVDHVPLTNADCFVDVGSGLGRVVIMVNLMTGIRARGIEINPLLCADARRIARELNLANVDFVCADARDADYREGSVFFLFTPFRGDLRQAVLDRLRAEAQTRPIRICTFGSITRRVAEQPWLQIEQGEMNHPHRVALFRSV
jgi:SAM-dependent methyltransferase